MRSKYLTAIIIIMGNFTIIFSQIAPAAGDGSLDNPYQISLADNIAWIQEDAARWDEHYLQKNNINISDLTPWITIGNATTSFTGSYNGDGFAIENLTINTTNGHQGFFGFINSATISNLGLSNVSITAGLESGALIAMCDGSTITNCYSTGEITATGFSIGGLIGESGVNNGTVEINNSYSSVTIENNGTSDYSQTGGFIGFVKGNTTIDGCYATGNITSLGNSIGGFVGYIAYDNNNTVLIERSYCTGNVSMSSAVGDKYGVGGFAGYMTYTSSGGAATISECYSLGTVSSAVIYAGGFIGRVRHGTIRNCYSFGDVKRTSGSDTQFGGFIGRTYENDAIIENCYSVGKVIYEGEVNPPDKGFIGNIGNGNCTDNYFDAEASVQTSGNGATAEQTIEMKTQSIYTDWDFVNVWEISSGNYPELRNVDNIREIETISNGELSISVRKETHGIKLESISKNGVELLNISVAPSLFTLDISNSYIEALGGWGNVNITNSGTELTVQLNNPLNITLFPSSMEVTLNVSTNDEKSGWDISVFGLSDKSLLNVTFPKINIKAEGNDIFLRPKYSGQEIKNPLSSELNTNLLYPRGSGATMQFSAYYNNNYGIYLATHDSSASKKDIVTIARDGGLEYSNEFPIPNKTINGNDWTLPGYFALNLFEGNWYEASQVYREWASTEANYWPEESSNRTIRQNQFGRIGAWAYMRTKDTAVVRSEIEGFHDVAEVPVGILWYDWSQNIDGIDENYPKFFPEEPGMAEIVNSLQASGDVYIMPYTNGRMYDTSLDDYETNGKPDATKDEAGDVYTQEFTGNTFAVMCPAQTSWQNTLIDLQDELGNRIGVKGSYLDQVCHADPKECMDASHNHLLGGGSFWRGGYNAIVSGMHNTMPRDVFITSEGAADFLNDKLDGCYTLAWIADNLVPAYPSVYAGREQNFGISIGTGEYDAPSFYSKLATIFNFGIQVGGVTTSIQGDNRDIAVPARSYIKKLAKLRYKLKDYISFGKMLKPLINVSGMPTITSDWLPGENVTNVTISALQQSFWQDEIGNKKAIVFLNASKTETLTFTLDFTGSEYGLSGNLFVQEVTADNDGAVIIEDNHFVKTITLQPLEEMAYLIKNEGGVLLQTKIFFEGAYNSTTHLMNTSLHEEIPSTSPYAEDVRTVTSIPRDVVDWILVQLRETENGEAIISQSVFLHKNGRIVADDGTTNEIELNVPEGNYFIVLNHRNHLAIMSKTTVLLNKMNSILYDFTTGSNKYYGTDGAKQLE